VARPIRIQAVRGKLPLGMGSLSLNGTVAGQSYKLELGGAWLKVGQGRLAGWLHCEGEGEVNQALAVPH
jgi:hypothetical protein